MRTTNTPAGCPPAAPALCAAHSTRLRASIGVVDTVDSDSRTLSGLGLPIGEVGHTSIGPVTVAPDCELDWPADLADVKLVDEHQEPPQPIGYLTAQRRTDAGWRMGFTVGRTAEGDRALLLAAERLRDGFSVELDALTFNTAGELVRATVVRVAHVTTPAFQSARHDGLAASRKTTERNHNMTDEQTARLQELLATDPGQRSDDDAAELVQLAALRVAELLGITQLSDEQRAELTTLAQVVAGVAEAPAEPAEPAEPADQLAASRGARNHATVPGSLQTATSRRRMPAGGKLRELYAAQSRVLSGRSRPELEAALADVTRSANVWVAEHDYSGQLWQGVEYTRKYVANSMPGDLPSYKGSGWRWTTKPEVGDYAGDKAAVPSNLPVTAESTWTAARLAGAHDIDRKFFDFGDEAFIAAYYEAMRESYAVKSDAKALAFQLAQVPTGILPAAGAGIFRAAATAAQAVEDNTGAPVDFVYVNATDRLNLLATTAGSLPAFLDMFGITPEKFMVAPGVAAGSVVAGTRQATRFRELSGSPIRVEAINVANAGIDGGVFGYYATEVLHTGGVRAYTFT